MKGPSEIITTLGNEGKGPAAIAEELNARGILSRNRMPFTEEMVKGYMRVFGIGLTAQESERPPYPALEPTAPSAELAPTVFPDPMKATEDAVYAGVGDSAEEHRYMRGDNREYGHLGPAISEAPYRPGVLKAWPIHTDFRPHETTPEERWRWD